MNSVEYRQLCQLIKSMETSLSGKIDRFAKNMFDALKGLGIIDRTKIPCQPPRFADIMAFPKGNYMSIGPAENYRLSRPATPKIPKSSTAS